MGDADESYDFSNLQGFVESLRAGSQLVMGNRFAGGIRPGAMPPLHRYLGNPVLSFIGRLFFRSPVRDFHCGLRGFERQAILDLDLNSTGMEFASEMVVKATLNGLRVSEVPTTLSPDGRDRPPHLRSWRDGWRHLRFLPCMRPLAVHVPASCCCTRRRTGLAAGPRSGLAGTSHAGHPHAALCRSDGEPGSSNAAVRRRLIEPCRADRRPACHATGPCLGPHHVAGSALLLGLAILLSGAALAAVSVWMWSGADFRGVDPARLMRVAIPAATLMMAGVQVATTAFLMEFIRLAPRRAAGSDSPNE